MTCRCFVTDSISYGMTVYDGILSDTKYVCGYLHFGVSPTVSIVDKIATYLSSPTVRKFFYLSGFLITYYTSDCLT